MENTSSFYWTQFFPFCFQESSESPSFCKPHITIIIIYCCKYFFVSHLLLGPAPLTPDQLPVARQVCVRWRRYRFNSLKSELLGAAILLKEANAISMELQKQVTYQFVVLTDTPYSPLSLPVATGMDVDANHDERVNVISLCDVANLLLRPRGPIIAVEVRDSKHGTTHLWSLNKLRY